MLEVQQCGRCKREKDVADFSPSYRGKRGTWCRDCFAAYARGERVEGNHVPRVCQHCGGQYVPRQLKLNAAFCSRGCKDAARRASEATARVAGKPDRRCLQCGSSMPRTMRAEARFCSAACNARAHAAGRRKKTGDRDYVITRACLHERDNGICAICGEPVDLTVPFPALLSASVDHIRPLSLGGTHEDSNLRVVHLSCNSSRGARVTPRELASLNL